MRRVSLLLGLALVAPGCRDSQPPEVQGTGQLIVVDVTPAQPVLRVGDTLRLTARSLPPGWAPFTWSSNATTVASVTREGLITGHDTGTVVLLARSTRDTAIADIVVVRVTRGP